MIMKSCTKCTRKFKAPADGRFKICAKCMHPPCQWCKKPTKRTRNKFCSNECSGKWQYKNLPQVRATLVTCRKRVRDKEECEKISLAKRGRPRYDMRGENNSRWKDGKSAWSFGDWTIPEWRRQVLLRDNFKCQKCGKKSKSNHAHHIKEKRLYPKLVTTLKNGQTLCKYCHHSHHMTKDNPRRPRGAVAC